jgi:peptidoglycan/LPS O-acetylase OafA/YrhL
VGSIRLLLALAVVFSHATACGISMLPGHVAVQAFFIVSGFYMSLILNEKYKNHSVLVFYSNRFLRLFPTYVVVMIASLVVLRAVGVGVFTRTDEFEELFTHNLFVATSYVWTNLAIIGQEVLFLLGIDPVSHAFYWAPNGMASAKAWHHLLVPQAWSLSLEWYFYLLAPFVLRLRLCWIALIFVSSLLLRFFILSLDPEYDLFVRRFFPAELCLFLAGSISYYLFTHVKDFRHKRSLGAICWATLPVLLIFYDTINKAYALSVMGFAFFVSMPFIFDLTKNNRTDRFLGNLSYSIYMVHFLIIALVEEYREEYSIFMVLLPILVASLIVYFSIEAPVDRWRQGRVEETASALKRPWLPITAMRNRSSVFLAQNMKA